MQNLRLSRPWKKVYKQVVKELVTGFINRRLKVTFIDLDTEEQLVVALFIIYCIKTLLNFTYCWFLRINDPYLISEAGLGEGAS